jgi:hypothetical protein
MRKMNRRIIGGESGKGDWYQKWYARYLCREWARTHRGVMPQKVELFKLTYKMPSPETVAKQGWYHPDTLLHDTGREERSTPRSARTRSTASCPTSSASATASRRSTRRSSRPWVKDKKKAWDKRLEPPAQDRDRDQADLQGRRASARVGKAATASHACRRPAAPSPARPAPPVGSDPGSAR